MLWELSCCGAASCGVGTAAHVHSVLAVQHRNHPHIYHPWVAGFVDFLPDLCSDVFVQKEPKEC